jgi:hypothetical protein
MITSFGYGERDSSAIVSHPEVTSKRSIRVFLNYFVDAVDIMFDLATGNPVLRSGILKV